MDGAKPADVIVNGPNGVDNSFGKNIVAILLGLWSDFAVRREELTADFAASVNLLTGGKKPCTADIESVLLQLREAADIGADGEQDPTKPCDGISFGLGFEAKLAAPLGPPALVPSVPDPCGN